MDNKKFGAFIAAQRKEKGLTQKELADKLCVTDKAVSKWERGLGFPDIKLIEPLSEALDVSILEETAAAMKKLAKDKMLRALSDQRYASTVYEQEMTQDALLKAVQKK